MIIETVKKINKLTAKPWVCMPEIFKFYHYLFSRHDIYKHPFLPVEKVMEEGPKHSRSLL